MKIFQGILILSIGAMSLTGCNKDPSEIFDGEWQLTSHSLKECSHGIENSSHFVSSRPCDGDIFCNYVLFNFNDGVVTKYRHGGIAGITSHTTIEGTYTHDKKGVSICLEEKGVNECIKYFYAYKKRNNKLTLTVAEHPDSCKEVLTLEKR